MVEKSDNIKLSANNQFMDGMINYLITKIKSYHSEPALYLWYFYKNLTMASKHLADELKNTGGWLQTRKCKVEKKNQGRNGKRRKRR